MKLLLLLNLILVDLFKSEPSHFRITPLSFYTPDNRNDKYFTDNKYGVRLSWIGSPPPSENIIINNNINLKWEKKGLFNVHKNKWGDKLWDYSFVDTSLSSGQQKIMINNLIYNVNIPYFGKKVVEDDTTIFIGDPNIDPPSRWSLGNADKVIKSKIYEYQNKARLIVWAGDIFYHDDPAIINSKWPQLTSINNNIVSGVPTFLHVSLLGNHDYSSTTACNNCHWTINKNGLSCSNNNEASAIWVQYFFATDGLKSFDNQLSNIYHRGCRVPYEYTTQIFVFGRTGYIIIDNTWKPEELNVKWNDINNKLNNHVDTILIIGHWDYTNDGGSSVVKNWISYLSKYFNNKKIIGVQGHTHTNIISYHNYNNINYQLVTVGGNGFKGSGCDCRDNCFNCHCCCPTLYQNNNWIIGGWNNNQFCNSLKYKLSFNNKLDL